MGNVPSIAPCIICEGITICQNIVSKSRGKASYLNRDVPRIFQNLQENFRGQTYIIYFVKNVGLTPMIPSMLGDMDNVYYCSLNLLIKACKS